MQLSVRDAARYLNVPEETVYRWISDGAIPFTQINEQYRLSSTDLFEWAAQRGVPVSTVMVHEVHGSAGAHDFARALEAGGTHTLSGLSTRDAVLEAIVKAVPLTDEGERDTLLDMVMAREVLGSTGIGGGFAIPHVHSPIVVPGADALVTLWYLSQPVDFRSPDGQAITTVFLVVSPSPRAHLHLLSRIAAALHDPAFRSAVLSRADLPTLLGHIRRLEAGRPP